MSSYRGAASVQLYQPTNMLLQRRDNSLLHRRVTFLKDGAEHFGYISATHKDAGTIDARTMVSHGIDEVHGDGTGSGVFWYMETFCVPTTAITGLEE